MSESVRLPALSDGSSATFARFLATMTGRSLARLLLVLILLAMWRSEEHTSELQSPC